jgi:hypothetical protein
MMGAAKHRPKESYMKRMLAAVALAGALALAPVVAANAQPVITGGLVNVVVGDVTILEDVRLNVALAVAANVCGVAVNVLAQQVGQEGPVTCETATGEIVQIIPAG